MNVESLVNRMRAICNSPCLDCTENDHCSIARQTPNPLLLEVISKRSYWCLVGNPSSENEATAEIRNICRQGKSEWFDGYDRPCNLTQIGFKSSFSSPCDLVVWWITSENNRAPFLYCVKLCASFQVYWWIQTGVTVRKRPIRVKIGYFFVPCDIEIWWMTLKNNSSPLLCYVKLCASFHHYKWIQLDLQPGNC